MAGILSGGQSVVDELVTAFEAYLNRLQGAYYQDEHVCWLPVRHHSPACAALARQRLDDCRPDVVLIEGPAGFDQHISTLQGGGITPPIAIYQQGAYFPLAENSPEWQALQWAGEHQVPVRFIDLDGHDVGDDARWNDARILSSAYSQRLQQVAGCRDGNELWLRRFELQQFEQAEDFFLQVLLFCAASRFYYDEATLAELGDMAREQSMRAAIRDARAEYDRVAVLTGGFHTSALFDYAAETARFDAHRRAMDSFLVRYSDELLDAHRGYDAGMPYPAFCRWLYRAHCSQQDRNDWTLFLLEQMPELTLIEKKTTFEHLQALSQLRMLTRPGCYDLLDSLGSCLLKQQAQSTSFAPWQAVLRGQALGELLTPQVQLPLVENVLSQCRSVRLTIGSAAQCHFALYDLSARARLRRQLLCKLQFLDIGFTHYARGLNPFYALFRSEQRESWSYHWTPAVEVALMNLSDLGGKLDGVVRRQFARLPAEDLAQQVDKLALALQLGLADYCQQSDLLTPIEQSSNIEQLADSFIKVFHMSQHPLAAVVDLSDAMTAIWAQLSFHLPSLNQLETAKALELLLSLQAIARQHAASLQASWITQLGILIRHHSHSPPLYFALSALLIDITEQARSPLLYELKQFGCDQFAVLEALITVVPHWLRDHDEDGLIGLMNRKLEQLTDGEFIAMLPRLRGLFCRMDAREIDGVSRQVTLLNQWTTQLNWFNTSITETDVRQGIALESQLQQQLTEEGLTTWIIH